jgi:hypothetical protein
LFLDLDAQLTPADQSLLRQRLDLGKRKLKQYAPQSPETRKRLASGLTTIGSVLFG